MERCSISPVARLTALLSLLLVALVTQPSTCNRDEGEGEEQADTLSVQLSVTAQVTPTPLWAVVWGPTQPLEDETYHFLSSQETDHLHMHENQEEASSATPEDGLYPDPSIHPQHATLESRDKEEVENGGTEAEETEPEEVDPQFYVTVIISSLLILTAVIITAKLCCSQHPPPLSRGVAPPLSLALPRSLASEDSRQTLHSTSSSFTDRESFVSQSGRQNHHHFPLCRYEPSRVHQRKV
ncbi:PILR alpha-associated neural protein isoform 2-T3 [Odontesthes bonariensis]|uniref:PILR alpha-associated neural protein isoform X2 n=1 Tax=Odontesthes bonariensis TaxID=219752 RepID=UPI003F58F111